MVLYMFFSSPLLAYTRQFHFRLSDISLTCFSRDDYLGLVKLPATINNTAMVFSCICPLIDPCVFLKNEEYVDMVYSNS